MQSLSRRLPRIVFSTLLLSTALLIISLQSVHAEPNSVRDITMSPSSTEISVAPGASATKSFGVINGGNDDYAMTTSVAPYHVQNETYSPQFTQLPGTTNVANWIHLEILQSKVPAHQMITVPYTVNVPEGTAPGGYYAVLFAETSSKETGGVIPHNRVGSILYITVTGPVKKSGTLGAVSIPRVIFGSQVSIGMRIGNTGGVHFLSTSTVVVKDLFGKQVYHATLSRYVLPQTERLVTTTWAASAPMGIYTVSRSADVAGTHQVLPDQRIMVVQPWLAMLVGVILLLIIVILPARRWYVERHTKAK